MCLNRDKLAAWKCVAATLDEEISARHRTRSMGKAAALLLWMLLTSESLGGSSPMSPAMYAFHLNEENCAVCIAAAERCNNMHPASLPSPTSHSLPNTIADYNLSGCTTTTSTCSQVAELATVTVRITSTVGCPSTTVNFNCPKTLIPTIVTTTSVFTTTVMASRNATSESTNSLNSLPIAIISSVLVTLLVMIVAALVVACLYIQLKKRGRCMQCIG